MVPNGWKEAYLGDVITHKKGFAFNSSSYKDKGIRIVRISDTTRNSIHSENPVYLAEEDVTGLEQYILARDDIVLSTVGSRPHLLDSMVGKAVKVPIEADGSLLNQNLVKVIPKTSKITNEYLFEMLKNKRFIFFISTLVRGNANQVSITLADLFQYQFVLPPLPEQKKIAQILSAWDKAITTTEKLLANSQQQKKALMQQLLTGKKRLLDGNGVRFKGKWTSQTISQISKRVQRKSDGEDHPILTISSLSGFVRQDERYSRYMAGESVKNYILLEKGEFAYNKGNSKTYEFGCIFDLENYETGVVPHVYVCFKLNPELSHRYFKYLFEADYLKPQLGALVNTGVRNNGLLNIKPSEFMETKVPVPCFEEQERIADLLNASSKQVRSLQKNLEDLRTEKKALMQQLLTGKRRVKEIVNGN